MNVINIEEKLSLFDEQWSPRIIAELNGQQVKLAKLEGEFIWHSHENEDEILSCGFDEVSTELRLEMMFTPRLVPTHKSPLRSIFKLKIVLLDNLGVVINPYTSSAASE